MKKHRRAIEKRQDEFYEKKGNKLEQKVRTQKSVINRLTKRMEIQAEVIESLKTQLEKLAKKNEK